MWFFKKKKDEKKKVVSNKERLTTEFPIGKFAIEGQERWFVDTSKCEILFAYTGTNLEEIYSYCDLMEVLKWVVKTSNCHFVLLKKYVGTNKIIASNLGSENEVENLYFKTRERLCIDNFQKTPIEI